ncbi:MAG: hypothetical protein KatS3mg022_0178 [Armatimonadota bacterium]|nr:MAG: hypothetical protein KatS3mg022_0178 [Armatimonadota bacterium]
MNPLSTTDPSPITGHYPLPRYECYRTIDRIRVDGALDEATWKYAPAMRLVLWKDGSDPERETRVKMAWDSKNLYIAYWLQDDSIRSRLRKRDAELWTEEVVEFFADAGGDLTDYCEFEWNGLGACVDLLVVWFREGVWHAFTEWDAKGMKWAVKTGKTVIDGVEVPGWQCEVAIPFTVFRDAPHLPPADGDTWRVNHYRIEMSGKETEYTCWSPVLGESVSYHRPHRFGHLVFRDKPTPTLSRESG